MTSQGIKAIDRTSIHRITSGQVVIDLQTAVKELVENSIDAGATNVEVRFKHHGSKSVEVIDNGSGISESDYENIALKHHTSKLESFSDLASIRTFGFRGEALSSLCAMSEQVIVTTSTSTTSPLGVSLEMDSHGRVKKRSTVPRQTGTTVTLTNLFISLPVRRKEFERNVKREFGKALSLLNAYALGPCSAGSGVRLTVSNQSEKGHSILQIKTMGIPSPRASVTALWGPKALNNVVDIDLKFEVEKERNTLRHAQSQDTEPVTVQVKGLISKFVVGAGRTTTDRQFFYINGRPCNMNKIQKAFNEVYRSFNATQAPFIMADFDLPTDTYDVNVSPDKRSILLHNEGNLILALKAALESQFSSSRSTYDLGGTQKTQSLLTQTPSMGKAKLTPKGRVHDDDDDDREARPDQSENLDFDRPNLAVPTPLSRSSSTKSPPPDSILSPQPLPSTNDDKLTDSCNPESGDRMDLDDTGSERDTMILDTSRASWSQPSGSTGPPSSSPKSDTGNNGHVRKKPKLVIPSRDDISMDCQSEDEEADCGRTNRKRERTPSQTSSFKKPEMLKGSAALRKPGNPRQNLRGHLVGYARTGSQISAVSEKSYLSEEEEDEGVDQLLSDDWPIHDDTQLAAASVTGCPDAVIDDDQVLGPPVGTSVLNSVDLTLDEDDDDEDPSSLLSQARASSLAASSSISPAAKVFRPEIIRSETTGPDISLKFNIDHVKQVWAERPKESETRKQRESDLDEVLVDASVANTENDEKAVDALSRVIEKDDFATMEIIGQFNLGFIVVRLRKTVSSGDDDPDEMDDLFIVDQHAADEKYNFETLQSTTVIQSQKLLKRQPLELTAADELLAMENIEVLRQNGFEIEIDEDAPVGQGSRLHLAAKPTSGSTEFDMKDLEELIHLMRDRPSGQIVRCSKVRAMFAMRACRKSVMIGMPLNLHHMTTVIRHMGTIDQPWHCPHGRPTMRHLLDMRSRVHDRPSRVVDWSGF